MICRIAAEAGDAQTGQLADTSLGGVLIRDTSPAQTGERGALEIPAVCPGSYNLFLY